MGSSGLRGASVVSSGGVNILHPLVVSEQEKHHGEEGKDYPLQYSGLESSLDCIESSGSQRVGRTGLSDFHFHSLRLAKSGALRVEPSHVCIVSLLGDSHVH